MYQQFRIDDLRGDAVNMYAVLLMRKYDMKD